MGRQKAARKVRPAVTQPQPGQPAMSSAGPRNEALPSEGTLLSGFLSSIVPHTVTRCCELSLLTLGDTEQGVMEMH